MTEDRSPKILRPQDDEAVEKADREDENEVDRAEEEDVERREYRRDIEQTVSLPESFDRALQQDPAEDQFLRQAGRQEDDDAPEEQLFDCEGSDPLLRP